MIELNEILVPTDFSETSGQAMEFAKLLAEKCGAELHVLHVADDPILLAPTTSESFRKQYEEQAIARLRELLTPHELETLQVQLAVRNGSAKTEICKYAEEGEADLIVIGSHGRGALANMLLGSTTEHVLRKACCPVVTVRK